MRPGERVCLFLKRSRDTYRGGQLLHTTSMGQGHLTLAAPGSRRDASSRTNRP